MALTRDEVCKMLRQQRNNAKPWCWARVPAAGRRQFGAGQVALRHQRLRHPSINNTSSNIYDSSHLSLYCARQAERVFVFGGLPVCRHRDRRLPAGHNLEDIMKPSETWVIPVLTHSHSVRARCDALDFLQRHTEKMSSCRRALGGCCLRAQRLLWASTFQA